MRTQIAAANWKMNLALSEAEALVDQLIAVPHQLNNNQLVILAVPFPYLIAVQNKIAGKKNIFVAAQNCYTKKSGAFTGEVSAAMLQSIGVEYVVLGHSERREYFKEDNSLLADKVNIALEHNLKPVFCCGEPLAVREAGTQDKYVETQLQESLFHLSEHEITGFIIAYEPIWAIGTGKTATNQQAQDMHANIRSVIAGKYSVTVADSISILYGGSVKASNAKEIFSMTDVDGGLVGGASLIADEFITIMNSLK
ncbi:MAG: triose-phosphate isomerase [Chitinophagaceae bacterium]|nr:triose-phosphate isomerase [Chitinophagaceae bacterium]